MPDITTSADVTVYRHVGCPYCEKVVPRALERGIKYRSRFVVPTNSERDIVKRLSANRSVPVVVDESTGVMMAENSNIVRYFERTYGDSHD